MIQKTTGIWKAVSLVLALVLSVVALSWVFSASLDSLKKQTAETLEPESGMVFGENVRNGIAVSRSMISSSDYLLYGVSESAESAYLLTATVQPADATNKKVDWTCAFTNAASAWAAGKTLSDYVTVTATEDGGLTAVAECLQGFGEQVTVTVTSRDDNGIYASCAVDYVKRINDLTVTLRKGSTTGDVVTTASGNQALSIPWNDTSRLYVTYEPVCGVGTLDDTFTYTMSMTVSDNTDLVFTFVDPSPCEFPDSTYDFGSLGYIEGGYTFIRYFIHTSYEDASGVTHTKPGLAQQYYDIYKNYGKNNAGIYNFGTFTITATGEYVTYTKQVELHYDSGTMTTSVSSIELDTESIVF